MLKYVSEILGKFTPQQRVIALLLLLLSIVLMTNGSDLIKAIKGTPDDVEVVLKNQSNQIQTQSVQIQTLQDETSRLNLALIEGQRECTNKILEREEEIAVKIQQIMNLGRHRRTNAIILDTVGTGELASPKMIIEDPTEEIMFQLGKLQTQLKHHKK
jgi:hypothetical protein